MKAQDIEDVDVLVVAIQGSPVIDLDELRAHKERVVGAMVAAHATTFHDSGRGFILGTARFVGERTVEVAVNDGGTRVLRGRDVVVNTGTTPRCSRPCSPSSGLARPCCRAVTSCCRARPRTSPRRCTANPAGVECTERGLVRVDHDLRTTAGLV